MSGQIGGYLWGKLRIRATSSGITFGTGIEIKKRKPIKDGRNIHISKLSGESSEFRQTRTG
ncbi:MAG: hypothetical protein KG003_13330 [Bacteroidetes bacterium]|nr:hypothetical protein [Bacteroidota bacterium]